MRLELVLEFKYFGCVLDKSVTDDPEYHRKVVSGGMLQVLLGPWLMLEVCSVKGFCMRYWLCLSLCMLVRLIWKENEV